ncbi:MAG: hypothetical protein ACLP0L_28410 [Solirubrobacteraceae bacterium]
MQSYPDGVESGPITVHSDAAAPWDPGIYNQSIPDEGYTYLTTRDGTQLAIDVHPPTAPAGEPGIPLGLPVPPGVSSPSLPITLPGLPAFPNPLAKRAHSVSAFGVPPYPTLIEYSGYGYADPSGPVNGIAVLATWRIHLARSTGSQCSRPDGLRGRRRQHAGDGLLGRRL